MRLLSVLAVILLVSSCGPDQKAIESNKFKEVMAVHDEVMPKMSDIRKLRKALEERVATLDSTSADVATIAAMITELDEANDSMMNWMRSFSQPEEGTAHEEVLQYYESEMERVMEVRDKMLTAIEKAEKM